MKPHVAFSVENKLSEDSNAGDLKVDLRFRSLNDFSPDQVARQAKVIARRNRRVISSRLVVCTVANPQWQDTVRALAATADAVVIDLSHATENVVWEVEQMRPDRWVLVCHRDRLAPLIQAAVPGSPYHRLGSLIDGHDVLVYGAGQRQFARSLRHRLDALTGRAATA